MKVRGRFGPSQWHALGGSPVRTECPWRYFGHLPASHDALAFLVGMVPLYWSGRSRRLEFRLFFQRLSGVCHAVGQRDRGLFRLLAANDLPQPVGPGSAPSASADLRDGTEIKQLPQIPVAHLGDAPQPLLAACRARPRRQAQLGRQVAA